MDLTNKTAMVTGGVSGLGKEIVLSLLENGIKHIAILDINMDDGAEFSVELENKYGTGRVILIKTDVTNENSFEDAFQETINTFKTIDIVINNVGIVQELNYELMVKVNLISMVRGTQLAMKYLSTKNGGNGGVILNTASMSAFLKCYPMPIYSATKSAIIQLVRSYGTPYYCKDSGLTIMVLCPGYTPSTGLFKADGCISKEMEEVMDVFLQTEKSQKPASVGRAAVHVIKYGDTGSVWMIDGGDLFKVTIPDIKSYSQLVVKDV